MSSPMEAEEYPGASGDTWDTAYLTRLSALFAEHSILLEPSAGSHTLAFIKRRRKAALAVARALAPPLLEPHRLHHLVDRFTEIYLAKRAEIVRAWRELGAGARVAHAPAWLRAVEPHLRHAAVPDPAEAVLRALTERARALRTTDPEAVCRALGAAPRARPEHLQRVWARMVASARDKLDALVAGGDSEAGLQADARLSRGEWRLVDALLLHDTAGTLRVVREEHARRAEPLRALVAVFHLVQLYGLEEGARGAEAERGWRAASAAYRRRGRLASAVLLQRRWHELKMQTRWRLAAASHARAGEWRVMPAPLHVAVARRFPQVAVAPLPPWHELVASGAVVEDCDLTQDVSGADELPAEGGEPAEWGRGRAPPPRADATVSEVEDDLILVEREIETVDLLTADDDDELDEQVVSCGAGAVKREACAAEETREVLRARRRDVAAALERELDRQLRELDEDPPVLIHDSDEEAPLPLKEEITDHESGDEAAPTPTPTPTPPGDEDEPAIDPKLLMTTSVPLMRVDEPAWRELVPPRARAPARVPARAPVRAPVRARARAPKRAPAFRAARALVDELLGGVERAEGGIRIVSIKSMKAEKCRGGEEEGGRRGRIRLPDIAEVRRINSGMKTAQVAPLVSPADTPPADTFPADTSPADTSPADASPAAEEAANVSSRRSSDEGALYIDEREEGGVLTSPELRSVLHAYQWHVAGGQGATSGGWRELYCCAARHHRALNDARRRFAARAGRPPPADAPVHAARCTATEGRCRCCCAHLLDAERAARALAADREHLLHDVRAMLAGTYEPGGDSPPGTHSRRAGTEEPEAPAAPPRARKAKKKKNNRKAIKHADPVSEPAADPLQEWIRQKNLTSRFFDLNLKKPEKTPKPTEPPTRLTPAPLPRAPPESAPGPAGPAPPDTASVITLSNENNIRNRTVNKVKVTVKTGAGTSSRSLLLLSGRELGGATKRARAPGGPCREPTKQARAGALPPNAIPVTMLQTSGGVRLMPVLTPTPRAPLSTCDVIDLCDDEPLPAPSSSPATATPTSNALLGKLPSGISVKRREVTPPPGPDARAREILSGLPPGIRVQRKGASASPTPPVVLLNERMPSVPCFEVSPIKKGNANIKVFKISEEGLLTPAGPGALRAAKPATKIVVLARKSGSGASAVGVTPRLLNTLLAESGASPSARLKITEIRKNGRRVLVMRAPADERPTDAPSSTAAPPSTPLIAPTPVTIPYSFDNPAMTMPVISPVVSMSTVFAPVASAPTLFTPAGSTIFTPSGSTPSIFTPITIPLISTPLGPGGAMGSSPTSLTPSITSDTSKATPARLQIKKASELIAPAAAEPASTDLETICSFEVLSDEKESETGASRDAPPDEGGAAVTLQGGAVVRPARPSHDFSELTITVEEWNARGGAPLVQVMERGAAPYRVLRGEYYVRTGRPLPLRSAAVWTPGPVSSCARVLVSAAPAVRRNERAYYLRLAAGVIVRAEWVCRTAHDVARAARAAAPLCVVHARSGHAHPLHCARAPRPALLALRCKFLTAAQQITQDVNQAEAADGHIQSYVRIAPRPPRLDFPTPTPPAMPAPPATPTPPALVSRTIEPVRPVRTLAISPLKSGRSLLKPLSPKQPAPPTRAPTPQACAPTAPVRAPTPPARAPTPPARALTPTARAPTPPEPARRSSRRAAHDARAKLTDIMKQDGSGRGRGRGQEGGEGSGSGDSDSGLDFSSAAGLEPADSDEEYDAAADLRRAPRRRAPARPRRLYPPSQEGAGAGGDDMELDDDVYGGIIALI